MEIISERKLFWVSLPLNIIRCILVGALLWQSYEAIPTHPGLALLGFATAILGWVGLK